MAYTNRLEKGVEQVPNSEKAQLDGSLFAV
jgi:hypothetical protein